MVLLVHTAAEVVDALRIDKEETSWFFGLCGQAIVGKNKWDELRFSKPWSEYVSPSCEAFMLLALENNEETWDVMASNELQDEENQQEVPKPRYTVGNVRGGKNQGYSARGKSRFKELMKTVAENRKEHNKETGDTVEKQILEIWNEKERETSMKRKENKAPDSQKELIDRNAMHFW